MKAPVSPLQVETPEEAAPGTDAPSESQPDRVYLDLTPVKSFLHSPSSAQARAQSPPPPHLDPPAEALPADPGPAPDEPLGESPESPELQVRLSPSREAGLTLAAPGPAKPCLLSSEADAAAGESRARGAFPENHNRQNPDRTAEDLLPVKLPRHCGRHPSWGQSTCEGQVEGDHCRCLS